MKKNKAIKEAQDKIRSQSDKRIASWIIKDDSVNKKVTVTAYSAGRRHQIITTEYES